MCTSTQAWVLFWLPLHWLLVARPILPPVHDVHVHVHAYRMCWRLCMGLCCMSLFTHTTQAVSLCLFMEGSALSLSNSFDWLDSTNPSASIHLVLNADPARHPPKPFLALYFLHLLQAHWWRMAGHRGTHGVLYSRHHWSKCFEDKYYYVS